MDDPSDAPQAEESQQPGPSGVLAALLQADDELKAAVAEKREREAAEAEAKSEGQFAALHKEQGLKALDALTGTSTRDQVISAVRQAAAGGISEEQVQQTLAGRGFDQARIEQMVEGLRADASKV